MNRQQLRTTLLATAFFATWGSPALADDTEVFVGQILNPGQPNVLFVVDTSGSMNSEVVVGQDYLPVISYEGVCDTDKVYWSLQTSGTVLLPDCQLAAYVNDDAFRCNAARDAFFNSGYYLDAYAQWRPDADGESGTWVTVTSAFAGDPPTGEERLVECRTDSGVHGADAASTDLYPADGQNGPWADTETADFWNETGGRYTFYSGNFLNYVASNKDNVIKSRIEVVQDVAEDFISSMSGINLGIARFSANAQGGQILHVVSDLGDNRQALLDTIGGLVPSGSTPLSETLFEASQYYAGRPVEYGLAATDENDDPLPSVAASYNADTGNYISPIVRECQRNYLVLLTDGLPTDDTDADGLITGLPDFADVVGPDGCSGNCLDELSIYINQKDQLAGAGAIEGDQIIETFVIGFATDQELLANAATGRIPRRDENGDVILDPDTGQPLTDAGYFVANDSTQLMGAFDSILQAIETSSETFSSPAVSINTFNRFTNRDDLYFAMFKPSELGQPHWDGNVKKYRLSSSEGQMIIVDSLDNPAVDENGNIAGDSRSFWSAETDGSDVTAGGVASRLDDSRNVYTNLFGDSLTLPANALSSDNDSLTGAHFSGQVAVADEDVPALADFARGLDENQQSRKILGDPLHSRPLVVSYGGDADDEDLALFFTTNDGYFHAIDPNPPAGSTTDLELFSFVPKELLQNVPLLKENAEQQPGNFQKIYGLDGALTRLIAGDDGDLVVEDGESLYVFFGMRRGGRDYYALNIADRANPRVAWSINGGEGDFAEMGQSWSAAVVGKIKWAGTERTVLFISGGYDPSHDDQDGASENDTMGRAMFVVDALTGQKLWMASGNEDAEPDLLLANMTNSIPSDPQILDLNQDGLIDRIYVGDTAAQLWRFDIFNNSEGDNATITGGRIADFGGGDASGNRRFFYPPSVTRIVDERYGSFLAIGLGSGFRANPLGEAVDDRFYVLRDRNVFNPQVDGNGDPFYITVTENQLLDISDNLTPSTDELNSTDGWVLDLTAAGEKSLSASVTADNRIFFTSYVPGSVPLTCNPVLAVGGGRLYELQLISGAPVTYDDPDNEERYTELDQAGIPPAPVLVFTEPPCDDCDPDDPDNPPPPPPPPPNGCNNPFSTVTMVIGTAVADPNICNAPVRTYWYQEDVDQ